IVIGNLGKSTIKNFKVYENGKIYQNEGHWNIDASQEEKAFKSGIIREAEHYELVWGIGDYGKHEYKLAYVVTDFVKQLDDSQMMFWQFVNPDTNIPPEKVSIEIETKKPLTDKGEKVWAFGYDGEVQFDGGSIVAFNDSPLKTDDYVTILAQFPDGLFDTNDVITRTFDEFKETAFEGSDYKSEKTGVTDFIFGVFTFIYEVISFLFVFLIFVILFIVVKHGSTIKGSVKRSEYKDEYYREVPHEDGFVTPYKILSELNVSDFNSLLSAFILKWIKEERLRLVTTIKAVKWIGESQVTEFHLADDGADGLTGDEAVLFELFKEASKDGVVNQGQFSTWAKENRKLVLQWEEKLKERSLKKLVDDEYVKHEIKKFLRFISIDKSELTEKGEEFSGNVYKFMNYLEDFSLLNEHEPVNVHLWDELMIWASVLGITDKVYEEFKKLYPSFVEESSFKPGTFTAVNTYARVVNSAITPSNRGGSGRSGGSGG